MTRKSNTPLQPLIRYGEQVPIHRPSYNLTPSRYGEAFAEPFDLEQKLPSHVPIPSEIGRTLSPIHPPRTPSKTSSPTSSSLCELRCAMDKIPKCNTNPTICSSSTPLQRRWMEDNARNVHTFCNQLCLDESLSSPRSSSLKPRKSSDMPWDVEA